MSNDIGIQNLIREGEAHKVAVDKRKAKLKDHFLKSVPESLKPYLDRGPDVDLKDSKVIAYFRLEEGKISIGVRGHIFDNDTTNFISPMPLLWFYKVRLDGNILGDIWSMSKGENAEHCVYMAYEEFKKLCHEKEESEKVLGEKLKELNL